MPHAPKVSAAFETLQLPSGQKVYFCGPPLSAGPLPAVFYFFTSGSDTLSMEPGNACVIPLAKKRMRVFSMSLPFHEDAPDPRDAVGLWAEQLKQGQDPLTPFLHDVLTAIDTLVAQQVIVSGALATAGLSRGGWVATHVAARSPHVRAVTAFAPITDFFALTEFADMRDNPLVSAMALIHVVEKLVGKPLRYYIGNRDIKVSTDSCYAFVRKLADLSFVKGVRIAPVELIISPSIGHLGHGTPAQAFHSGVRWLSNALGLDTEGYDL